MEMGGKPPYMTKDMVCNLKSGGNNGYIYFTMRNPSGVEP